MPLTKETKLSDETIKLLNLNRLPARLNTEQAAAVLGCQYHDVRTLVCAKMLKPLGNPKANAVKYFSASEIEQRSSDENWLNKATKILYDRWIDHNGKRKPASPMDAVLN